MISPEAQALAEDQAARDRDTLARLIREGKVERDPEIGKDVVGAAEFRREIEALVRPPVNTAIRPKRRRRR